MGCWSRACKQLSAPDVAVDDSEFCQGEVFLGSDGFGVTWNEYWHRLAEGAGAPKPRKIPNIAGRILAPFLEWVGHAINQKERPLITRQAFRLTGGENIFSTNKAHRLLGYEPLMSFEQAMSELADSFQK